MSDENSLSKNEILFIRLVAMFQTITLQQLGKIVDPIKGEVKRDLEGAKMSIDTLDMLSEKCRNNLTESEKRFLDHIRSELKLNYVDEVNRPDKEEQNTNQTSSEKK